MKDIALLCLTAHFLPSLVTAIHGSKFPESTIIPLLDLMDSVPPHIFVLSLIPKSTWDSTVIKLCSDANLCCHRPYSTNAQGRYDILFSSEKCILLTLVRTDFTETSGLSLCYKPTLQKKRFSASTGE